MKGLWNITQRELKYNLISWRMLLLFVLLLLAVTGASYGVAEMAILNRTIPNLTKVVKEPAEVMTLVTAFIHFFGSLVVIVLSFDTVANEKIQKTRYLLLVRPVTKRTIALGKFLGVYLALLIPFMITAFGALLVIIIRLGPLPFWGSVGFLTFTAMYVAIFVAIQQTLSSMVSTTGSATLSGVSLWILFVLFWPLIPASWGKITGIALETSEGFRTQAYLALIDKFSLFNPTMVYQSVVGLAFDSWELQGTSEAALYTSFFLWFVLSVCIYVNVFSHYIDKD